MINSFGACACLGPQNGQPLCPCKMRNVKEMNGRYVEVIDHGAVNKPPFPRIGSDEWEKGLRSYFNTTDSKDAKP